MRLAWVAVLTLGTMLTAPFIGCGDDSPVGGQNLGGGDSGGSGGAEAATGCDGVPLLANPSDTSLRGPWPVGARTVAIGNLTVEVWYPAVLGSEEAAAAALTYDVRSFLPPAEAAKISDEKAPVQTCECFADLPLDEAHGPYPAIVFVHGTAGFRTQSLEITTHWASRGFVVVAADHPGLYLGDLITSLPICDGDAPAQALESDIVAIVAALADASGDLAFLEGRIDVSRLAMSGHSAGGGAIENQGDVAEVLIPMAAGGVAEGTTVKSALVLGALEDSVVAYDNQVEGYDATVSPSKRLVGLSPGGHLTFSSLCSITNADGEDIVTIGTDADVCGLALAGALFDCDASYMPAERGWQIVNDATSAALEETLHCDPSGAEALATLAERYEEVAELREELSP